MVRLEETNPFFLTSTGYEPKTRSGKFPRPYSLVVPERLPLM